ncbi:DUF4917 domain-containing protein [Gammaproteobacteria bacterium ESL0073]|nr:DUF4917 domain-containing protein [Gammaproteobacteria bacterium ESL0073]
MPHRIMDWSDIKDDFIGSTIILGNGASIAVNNNFNYSSLRDHVITNDMIDDNINKIFIFFDTSDFELILRLVWQANNINKALNINDKITSQVYINIRDSLIRAVRNIHPTYESVEDQLPNIYNFLKQFNTIISLNYDLILYWTMMYGKSIKDYHAFKDCFISSIFDDNWQQFREPINSQRYCSLVFYPHGNLLLARNKIETETKISSLDNYNLLDTILQKWESCDYIPLFVSEGTKDQKNKSIQSSYYLNTVYREVLSSINGNLVIYGWGIGEQDMHIIDRVKKSRLRKIAVSVYGNNQAYCNRVEQIFNDNSNDDLEVIFFDSQSNNCWNR